MATRYILATDHWPDKLNHDATPLMVKIVERLGGPPLLLLSDKLRGYKTGYKNTKSEPPTTMHIPDAAVNNIRNNQHERHNGDGELRKKGSRGFNSYHTGAVCARPDIPQLPPAPHGIGRNDPRREGGHCNTWARQTAHPDTVRRGLPLQLYLMRPHVHDRCTAPQCLRAASGVINCVVWPYRRIKQLNSTILA